MSPGRSPASLAEPSGFNLVTVSIFFVLPCCVPTFKPAGRLKFTVTAVWIKKEKIKKKESSTRDEIKHK